MQRVRSLLSNRALVLTVLSGTFVVVGFACGESMNDASSTSSSSSSGGTSGSAAADAQAPTFDSGGNTCTGATRTTSPDAEAPTLPSGIKVADGFVIEAIAKVPGARHISALPNGDLLVGTNGTGVYLVPHADQNAGTPSVFTTIADAPVHSVTFHQPSCSVYFGSHEGVYRASYTDGQIEVAAGDPIAKVRQSSTGGHATTTVAVSGGNLYASVGSSCNACVETDPTRATVQQLAPDGTGMRTYAKRIRNAIALTVNPATGTVWAGGAGQDSLPDGHPYEYFDPLTARAVGADYGWPDCEEDNHAYTAGADCSNTAAPKVALPAFSTIIGATFYPLTPTGAHAFPTMYRGGALLAAHGSWHMKGVAFTSAPRVALVPMNGDVPAKAIDWTDPTTQWTDLASGFETADGKYRVGRPAGVAVGPDGSVFVSDDQNNLIYRIRPSS